MPAITGNYTPATSQVARYLRRWIVSRQNIDTPENNRRLLTQHLNEIRQIHGNQEAKNFRDYLLWVGTYPSSKV